MGFIQIKSLLRFDNTGTLLSEHHSLESFKIIQILANGLASSTLGSHSLGPLGSNALFVKSLLHSLGAGTSWKLSHDHLCQRKATQRGYVTRNRSGGTVDKYSVLINYLNNNGYFVFVLSLSEKYNAANFYKFGVDLHDGWMDGLVTDEIVRYHLNN